MAIPLLCYVSTVLVNIPKLSQGTKIELYSYRIGSLHGCIYIVNDDLKITDLEFEKDTESK